MLRPEHTRWFQVLVPHEAFAGAMDALAATGSVEVEPAGPGGQQLISAHALMEGASRFRRQENDFGMFWPRPVAPVSLAIGDPLAEMRAALGHVEQWQHESHRLINRMHGLDEQIREARLWLGVLEGLGEAGIPLASIEVSARRIEAVLCCGKPVALSGDLPVLALPLSASISTLIEDEAQCQLLVGPAGSLQGYREAHDARCHGWPEWLRGREEPLTVASSRYEDLERERAETGTALRALAHSHALASSRGMLQHLAWLADHLDTMATTRHLVRLQGWSAKPLECVEAALSAAGIPSLVVADKAPTHLTPPLLLRHRPWVRPFETFVRALGMPAGGDADPTPVLALAVPLLFGYMFGDVGHGLVFLLLGLVLQRRWVQARLLVWGGASAMVFGFLYGSVFTNETWLTPLWLHPLHHPVTVLVVSLWIGVGLLGCGLLLNTLQAWWQRDVLAVAWIAEVGLIAIYAGVLASLFNTASLWLSLVGLVLMTLVAARSRGGRGVLLMLGELVERLFQLLINTLSFVRVGAFALAHAGLASAVVSLAAATELMSVKILVLLLGNVLILAIEGLVVSIQTTRLVLFEFFVRFLKGGGRVFKPIEAPPHYRGVQRESS